MQSVQPKVPVRFCGPAPSPQLDRLVTPRNQSSVCSPSKVSIRRSSHNEVQGTPASAFIKCETQTPVPIQELSISSVPEFVASQLRSVPREFRSPVSRPSVSQSRCSAYVTGQVGASSPKRVLARAFERIRQTAVSSKFQSMRQRFAVPRFSFKARAPFEN